MEKIELSPVEAMKALGWKKNKVYYWITTGKFKTVERLDGQKIVLSVEDFERLKENQIRDISENFEKVENNSKQSEEVQNFQTQNDTKVYKTDSKSLNSEQMQFMQTALDTIKQIHQSSLQNYAYNIKMLTDGKNELEEENLMLKAEVKTVQEKLKNSETEKTELIKKFETEKNEQMKSFEKVGKVQIILISVLSCLFLFSVVLLCLDSNSSKNSEKEQYPSNEIQIEQKKEPAPQAEPIKSVKPAKQVRK